MLTEDNEYIELIWVFSIEKFIDLLNYYIILKMFARVLVTANA